jgi:hypothetical protein
MIKNLILTISILLTAVLSGGSVRAEELNLSAGQNFQTVYRWSTQRCSELYIPDSPARAFRRTDGSVVLIAAHYLNQFMEGPSFDQLSPNCSTSSSGRESDNPADFDTRYWIQALLPTPAGIIGLASHEYSGIRHHNCAKHDSGSTCWYSSILELVASENTFHFDFTKLRGERFVAAPPLRFDPARPGRYGFISTSNVVVKDGWAYVFIWSEIGGTPGNCLFRAPSSDPLGHWAAYQSGSFSQRFGDPYAGDNSAARCDLIGNGKINGQLRSVIRINGLWVGVFQVGKGPGFEAGVYYSTSPNMIDWSTPRLLLKVQQWYGAKGCDYFYGYPSLIDHGSTSRIFDTGGKDLFLYLTRLNWKDCNKGLDRDLVRTRVSILPGG